MYQYFNRNKQRFHLADEEEEEKERERKKVESSSISLVLFRTQTILLLNIKKQTTDVSEQIFSRNPNKSNRTLERVLFPPLQTE